MADIYGNNVEGSQYNLTANVTHIHNHSTYTFTPNVDKEVFKFHLYSGTGNTGDEARVGIYNVSVSPPTLVSGSETIFTGDGSEGWKEVDRTGTEVELSASITYALAVWSDGYSADVSSDYESNNILRDYNATGTLPAEFVADSSSYTYPISMYVEANDAVTSTVTITDVNGDATIEDGETGIVITGTGFGIGGNTVTICLVDDVNDASATEQTITAEASTTEITFTVVTPGVVDQNDTLYVFVTNGADTNVNGYAIGVTPVQAAYLHTLELIDKTTIVTAASGFTTDERYEILVPGDTNWIAIGAADNLEGTVFTATGAGSGTGTAYHIVPCICESTNFVLGVTAELWPADVEANKEIAPIITAIDTAPTSTPRFDVVFSVAPSNGDGDTLHFIYDATIGDIKSVTGGIALASGTFDATVAMTCA